MRRGMEGVSIIPATQQHIDILKGKLRKQDQDELVAATGLDPDIVLQESFDCGKRSWCGLRDGIPCAVFGVQASPGDSGLGTPWMLGTEDLTKEGRVIVTLSKSYVQDFMKGFRMLQNYVDARNIVAQQWLRWCGFALDAHTVPYGPFRMPFYRFYKEAKYV